MKITALLENTTRRADIGCEHGLSLYIDTGTHKILFDMGQSSLFYENAIKLGVDLTKVDFAVISHGHNDHGGGLATFLEINKTAPVYVSQGAFIPHYNARGEYIGLDTALRDNPRIKYVSDITAPSNGITLYPFLTKDLIKPISPWGLTELENGTLLPEEFRHEQYLEIKENGKTVLFSGCSHRDILNIVNSFEPTFLIGGFHISKEENSQAVLSLAKELSRYKTFFYTCHCTGLKQYATLKEQAQKLLYLAAGDTIVI